MKDGKKVVLLCKLHDTYLSNNLHARFVDPSIKNDILELRFDPTTDEQLIYDEILQFKNPFFKWYFMGDPSKKRMESFYEFWKTFINYDGTCNGHKGETGGVFRLMTSQDGNKVDSFIRKAREAYKQDIYLRALDLLHDNIPELKGALPPDESGPLPSITPIEQGIVARLVEAEGKRTAAVAEEEAKAKAAAEKAAQEAANAARERQITQELKLMNEELEKAKAVKITEANFEEHKATVKRLTFLKAQLENEQAISQLKSKGDLAAVEAAYKLQAEKRAAEAAMEKAEAEAKAAGEKAAAEVRARAAAAAAAAAPAAAAAAPAPVAAAAPAAARAATGAAPRAAAAAAPGPDPASGVPLAVQAEINKIDKTKTIHEFEEIRKKIARIYKFRDDDVNESFATALYDKEDEDDTYNVYLDKIVELLGQLDRGEFELGQGQGRISSAGLKIKALLGKPPSSFKSGTAKRVKEALDYRKSQPLAGGAKTSSNSRFRTTRKAHSR